jgi:septum formation protein
MRLPPRVRAKPKGMSTLRLYLASASPRRLELLRQIGLDPELVAHRADERRREGESPEKLVRRLAEAKARSAAGLLGRHRPAGVLLAADTAVTIDGEVLGKPHDAGHAEEMLRRLRGAEHEVVTGLCMLRSDDGRSAWAVVRTRVSFRHYDDETIRAYVASGEPLDKAGAYGIQGRGALLASRIEGSWSNVVGLPLERVPECLERLGVSLRQLMRESCSRKN